MRRSLITASAVAVASAALGACGGSASVKTGSAPVSAASFLPAGSLAYVEASTDLSSVQWQTALDLANRFPGFQKMLDDAQKSMAKDGTDFARDIRPLLGKSAAAVIIKLTPADLTAGKRDTPPPMVLAIELAPGQASKAEALLLKSATGRVEKLGQFEGATMYRDSSDKMAVAAIMPGALLMATDEASLKSALSAHASGNTMASSERLKASFASLPQNTIAQAYLDMAGLVNLAKASQQGASLKQLDAMGIGPNAALGLSLTAEQNGMRVKAIGSDMNAKQAAVSFTPTYTARVPAGALAFASMSNLFQNAQTALTSAMAQDEQFKMQANQARGALALLGVSVDDLKTLLSGEVGVTVTPGAVPAVVAMLGTQDGKAASAIMDRLRSGVATFAQGKVPAFQQVPLGNGVTGWESKVDPKASLVYGVDGNTALVGTNANAVRLVQTPKVVLSDDPAFREATSQMPAKVEGLFWANGTGLWDAMDALGAFKTAPKEALPNLRPIQNMAMWSFDGGQQMEAFITVK